MPVKWWEKHFYISDENSASLVIILLTCVSQNRATADWTESHFTLEPLRRKLSRQVTSWAIFSARSYLTPCLPDPSPEIPSKAWGKKHSHFEALVIISLSLSASSTMPPLLREKKRRKWSFIFSYNLHPWTWRSCCFLCEINSSQYECYFTVKSRQPRHSSTEVSVRMYQGWRTFCKKISLQGKK